MKRKKIVAVLLCFVMTTGLLSGCMAKPYEKFFEIYDEIQNITEGDYKTSIEINVPKNISENKFLNEAGITGINDLDEDFNIKILFDGTQSVSNKMASANISYSLNGGEMAPITSVVIDGSKLYLDLITAYDEIINVVNEFEGSPLSQNEIDAARDELISKIDNKSWIVTTARDSTTGEEFDFWSPVDHVEVKDVAENNQEETLNAMMQIIDKVGSKLKTMIEVGDYITKTEDGTYLLTINNEESLNLILGIMDDMELNFDSYWELFKIVLENQGAEVDEEIKNEFLTSLKDGRDAAKEFLTDTAFNITMEVGYDKKSGEYIQNSHIYIADTIDIKIDNVYMKEQSAISIPDAFDIDPLIEQDMLSDVNTTDIIASNMMVPVEDNSSEMVDISIANENANNIVFPAYEGEENNEDISDFTMEDVDLTMFEDPQISFTEQSQRLFSTYASDINENSFETTATEFVEKFDEIATSLGLTDKYTDNDESGMYTDYSFSGANNPDAYSSGGTTLNIDVEDGEWITLSIDMYHTNYQDKELTKKFVEVMNAYGYSIDENEISTIIDSLFSDAEFLTSTDEYRSYMKTVDLDDSGDLELEFYVSYDEYDDCYNVNVGFTEYHTEF